jgi:hypothetical protein
VSCNYLKNNTIGLSPEILKFIDFLVSGSCIIQGAQRERTEMNKTPNKSTWDWK